LKLVNSKPKDRFEVRVEDEETYYVFDNLFPGENGCVLYFGHREDAQTITDIMNKEWNQFAEEHRTHKT